MNPSLRVLYAEDNPDAAVLTRSFFASFAPQIELVIVDTGKQCLEQLEAGGFDVLLLDYRLPDIEGLQVLKSMAERRIHIPTVIVTAMGDEELVVKALRMGASDYVPKNEGYLETLPDILRAAHEESHPIGGLSVPFTAVPRRILYLEHVASDIDLTLRHFDEHAPYLLVDVAGSGREALLRLSQKPRYDVVLADLRMPDLGGLEFLHRLKRKLDHCPPFIMVTGKGDDALAIAALKLGAADYIVKNRGYLEKLVYTIEQVVVRDQLRQVYESLQHELAQHNRAEAELAETHQHLQVVIRAANVGLWDWNVKTGKAHFYPEWKHQLGYEEDEITDDFSEWETRLHPDDKEPALQKVQKFLLSEEDSLHNEFRLRHKNDSYRRIVAQGTIERDSAGRATRMRGSHLDVTEAWEVGEQLRQAQKMEAIGQLAGGIAHDFNNKLSVMLGYTEMALARVADDSALRAFLIEVRDAAQSSANLTRQLMAFARKQPIKPTSLNLGDVIGESVKMVRLLIPEEIEIRCQHQSELWPVSADPTQIDQLVSNLVTNARDAIAGPGLLSIEVRNAAVSAEFAEAHADARDGDYVVLSVSDDGCGMDELTLGRVFEPFFTTKETGKGTGLGLATVYGIMRQNDGFIVVHSEVGVGTTFELYFPRVAEKAAKKIKEALPLIAGGGETILVVEDEASLLQLIETQLSGLGYTVLGSRSPTEALQLVHAYKGPIDLVITDVIMPEMNGRNLAALIRQARPGIRSIFVSGYSDDVIADHGVLHEDVNFIAKPFSKAILTRKIREVLAAPGV